MTIESSIGTVAMLGVSLFLGISLFRSIKDPSQRWRAVTYLVTFTTCIVILEQIMKAKLTAEGISGKASCSPGPVPFGAEPAYSICNGFFVSSALGARAFETIAALRSYAIAFTASGAATQIILLKLKWQLAKAAPSGEFPIIMAFLSAAMSFLTLYHAPEILDAANLWIGNASSSMKGIAGFYNWMGYENSAALEAFDSGGWSTAAFWVSLVKMVLLWVVFGVYLALGFLNFAIFLCQSIGVVLLPLVFCLLFLLGSATWESNLKVIGFIALMGIIAPAQNFAIDLVVGSATYAVPHELPREKHSRQLPLPLSDAPENNSLEGLADIAYDRTTGFSPSSFMAFMGKASLGLLIGLVTIAASAFALLFGVFTFGAKIALGSLAQSVGASRQADWMAGAFSNGKRS